ncbi:hypothetical protein Glove_71g129 [Diversispora epigaea]|uniref:Uncharacterized protein n=1 Tax=Diversispora epigaea TaxID=1348612 RepID=A0A397JE56_9GLOM|nr:hypothetical protein Glove_71g129 [Diversispora epigaea]
MKLTVISQLSMKESKHLGESLMDYIHFNTDKCRESKRILSAQNRKYFGINESNTQQVCIASLWHSYPNCINRMFVGISLTWALMHAVIDMAKEMRRIKQWK